MAEKTYDLGNGSTLVIDTDSLTISEYSQDGGLTALLDAIRKASDLDELQAAIIAAEDHFRTLDREDDQYEDLRDEMHYVYADLPTWGGPEHAEAGTDSEVYSWDATRVMRGGDYGWKIEDREDV